MGRRGAHHDGDEDEGEDDEVSIPLRLIEALTRLPLRTGATTTSAGSFINDVERAMRAAFGALGERAATNDDGQSEPGDGPHRDNRSRPRLPRAVRQALDHFESAFVEAANAMEHAPAKPAHVLAYSSLCVRLVLRYRLKDGENRAAFWSSAATLVRALLCPLGHRAALVSLLHAPGAAVAEDAAQLLALLVALLAWHGAGGRLDGEGVSAGLPIRVDVIREALASLDRAAEATAQPSSLPRTLNEAFPDAPEKLAEVLARMRQTPSASDRALSLKAHLEAVVRGEAHPATTSPEREIARNAQRAPPLFVVPWTSSCPHCNEMVAAAVRGRLLVREPVQCRNTRCSRWLVPSEGA